MRLRGFIVNEVNRNLSPTDKIDAIEKGEGREKVKVTMKVKKFAVDWDGWLEKLYRKYFKKEK